MQVSDNKATKIPNVFSIFGIIGALFSRGI